jgi:hypothetical protein
MPRLLACLLATLLVPASLSARQVVSGVSGGFNGQPARDVRPATGRSTIRGRVVSADSGQPLRRAEVRISAAELRVQRRIFTDADGRYEFGSLPVGRYSINALKTTFVGWGYGQTQFNSPGKPLVLADNQTADNINISLPRGAVITGRVTDDFGDTVPNVRVQLMRQQFRQGARTLVPGGSTVTTNDIGEYRVFGLTPGSYYLAAMPQPTFFGGPAGGTIEGPESRTGYAPTFYPGTAEVASARKLTVGIGQTLGEINIMLLATRTATISGIAVDVAGRPMGGFVQIVPRGGATGLGGPGGPIRPDGTFSISDVTPGSYVLRANSPRVDSSGPLNGPPEFSLAFVTVAGDDVTGIRLAPIPPVSINGRVSFEDQAAAQSLKPSAVRVVTLAATVGDAGIGIGSGGAPMPIKDDFTFELKTTPGQMGIRALAPGWQVKAIRVNGTDVTDSGLDVGSQGASGVEIEMTNRLQEISGVVTDADRKAVDSYVVVMFAQDRARWVSVFNRYGATARPGNDGRFKVTTLPAGDYYAIALDRSDAIEGQDPEFLDGLTRLASTVSLTPGETRTLDLKLFTVQ